MFAVRNKLKPKRSPQSGPARERLNAQLLSFKLLLLASRKARRSSPASRSLVHCS